MLENLKKIIQINKIKWALFMAFLSTFIISLIAIVDLNFDFVSGGFQNASSEMKFVFYTLAIYLFIKAFTFLNKFSFWILMIFTLIFMIDFYLTLNIITGFDGSYQNLSECTMYQVLSALNFLYIFILNLLPAEFFRRDIR